MAYKEKEKSKICMEMRDKEGRDAGVAFNEPDEEGAINEEKISDLENGVPLMKGVIKGVRQTLIDRSSTEWGNESFEISGEANNNKAAYSSQPAFVAHIGETVDEEEWGKKKTIDDHDQHNADFPQHSLQ